MSTCCQCQCQHVCSPYHHFFEWPDITNISMGNTHQMFPRDETGSWPMVSPVLDRRQKREAHLCSRSAKLFPYTPYVFDTLGIGFLSHRRRVNAVLGTETLQGFGGSPICPICCLSSTSVRTLYNCAETLDSILVLWACMHAW